MNKKTKGIILILISALSFAVMNTFVKLSGDLPSMEKTLLRNSISLIVSFIILVKNKQGFSFKKENLGLLILRSAAGTVGIIANFYAVDNLLLADASMLGKMSPFFTIIFSFIFLKEKLRPYQITGIIVAFVGAILVIKPSFQLASMTPGLIGLLGAVCAGGAYTVVRRLSQRGEKSETIIFFFSAFSIISILPFVIPNFQPMTFEQLAYLLLAGVAATSGQFALTYAYALAPAGEISVFDYSQIVFAAIMGFFIFGQIPDGYSFMGYGLMFACGIWVFLKGQKEST